jgi:dCMP deaminase
MSNIMKWDLRFLQVAKLVSTWSKDPSTQCGAAITDEHRNLVSVGYNGFPRSMPDKEEYYLNREEKYSRIVHCEVNALNSARRDVHGCTLYTWPCLSCDRCFVQMVQAGMLRYVAPEVTEDMNSRWGPALAKVRKYRDEMNEERARLNQPLIVMLEYPGLHG